MATKTLRLFFQIKSNDGTTPVELSISVDDSQPQLFNLNHTDDWLLDDGLTDASNIDLMLDTPVWDPESEDNLPNVNLTIIPTGGDVLFVGGTDNYANGFGGGAEFAPLDQGPIDIVAQPTIDGEIDTLRYDFPSHTAAGGTDGMGNFPIYDGESGNLVIQYNFYQA